MKKGIHPEYKPATIVCSCGNEIETRSTQDEIHVEICAVCHPFYTGRQKLVDTAGRVERFKRKYGDTSTDASEEEGAAEEEPEAGGEEESSAEAEAEAVPQGSAEGAGEAGTGETERPSKVGAGAPEEEAGEEPGPEAEEEA